MSVNHSIYKKKIGKAYLKNVQDDTYNLTKQAVSIIKTIPQ